MWCSDSHAGIVMENQKIDRFITFVASMHPTSHYTFARESVLRMDGWMDGWCERREGFDPLSMRVPLPPR